MMRVSRRGLLAVVLVGGTAGLAAAALQPTARSTPAAKPFAGPSAPARTEPSREAGPGAGNHIYLRAHGGTIRDEVVNSDPAGGADWVLRVFEADRMIPTAQRRPGTDGVASVALCAQLGRKVGGRFGWIDGDNVFRPVTTRSITEVPWLCTSRKLDTRHTPEVRSTVLVDRPGAREPEVRGAVVWGLVGGAVRRVLLTASGQRSNPAPSKRWGGFIRFAGPGVGPVAERLVVDYSDGERRDTDAKRDIPGRVPPGYALEPGDALVPSATRVIARAPDPAGGPSWALVGLRSERGLWCLGSTGYLIDGHVGYVEPELGTLTESAGYPPNGCGKRAQPTAERPIQFVTASGTDTDHPLLAPDASKLRLQRGRTIVSGRTLDDVESVTIQTPRDVRTVEVDDPGHGFLVVYDGTFPGSGLRLTAHFDDGRSKVMAFGMP